jgi:hypothetical protein
MNDPSASGKQKRKGKRTNGNTDRVRGASGYVAVRIATCTYEAILRDLPKLERRAQDQTGFIVHLSAGTYLDWLVKEHVK